MTHKHKKIYSTSLAVREMQTDITRRDHYTPITMAKIKFVTTLSFQKQKFLSFFKFFWHISVCTVVWHCGFNL